ncbi:MAG: hypothetical protein GY850_27690 [bacterium]|nr:hypothetical protein [bacterium]
MVIFLSFLAQFIIAARTGEYLDNITISTNGGGSAVTSLLQSARGQNLILTITVTASFCVKLKTRPLFHPHLTYIPLPYSLHQPLSAIPTAACPIPFLTTQPTTAFQLAHFSQAVSEMR